MKLTKQNIDRLSLAPGQSELIKSSDDVPGLRFRVRSNGSRSWEFKFGNPPAPEPTVVIVERPSEGSAELGSRDFDIAAFNKKPRSWWC